MVDLLQQLLADRLKGPVDLLLEFLPQWLQSPVHLLLDGLGHLLFHLCQHRLHGLRNLLLQRLTQVIPNAGLLCPCRLGLLATRWLLCPSLPLWSCLPLLLSPRLLAFFLALGLRLLACLLAFL